MFNTHSTVPPEPAALQSRLREPYTPGHTTATARCNEPITNLSATCDGAQRNETAAPGSVDCALAPSNGRFAFSHRQSSGSGASQVAVLADSQRNPGGNIRGRHDFSAGSAQKPQLGCDPLHRGYPAFLEARGVLANVWRNRNLPLEGWAARHMTRDYPMARRVVLAWVLRTRAAMRVARPVPAPAVCNYRDTRHPAWPALTSARFALADIWHSRKNLEDSWIVNFVAKDYPNLRKIGLARVMRCRAAMRQPRVPDIRDYSMANAPSDYRSVV